MHCACVESDGEGLLIAGMSGAGKSTLSVALSQGGFNYISDDWTYISQTNNQIVAHGTSASVKLLPDAVRHFQALTGYNVHVSMNGELAYEVDIVEAFGARVEHACEPRWLFLLERMQEMGSEFLRLPSVETKRYLDSSVERLPKQLIEAAEKRDRTIDRISRLPCWRFRYGGTPQYACKELLGFIAKCRQKVYV
jgi:energy-coupling factor transporter ATP-binding protein EcfA2